MRYASLENDIIKIIKEQTQTENLDSFNRLIKEAIEIINGVELYHFNGLRVDKIDEINENKQDNIVIHLINQYPDHFLLTISKDGKTLDINNINQDYFHFGLKESNVRDKNIISLYKNKISLSFKLEDDIINIVGEPFIYQRVIQKIEYTVSYYEGVAEYGKELNLEMFVPDKKKRTTDENEFNYIEPTQINDILKEASILKEKIEEAPYQKKRKIHY